MEIPLDYGEIIKNLKKSYMENCTEPITEIKDSDIPDDVSDTLSQMTLSSKMEQMEELDRLIMEEIEEEKVAASIQDYEALQVINGIKSVEYTHTEINDNEEKLLVNVISENGNTLKDDEPITLQNPILDAINEIISKSESSENTEYLKTLNGLPDALKSYDAIRQKQIEEARKRVMDLKRREKELTLILDQKSYIIEQYMNVRKEYINTQQRLVDMKNLDIKNYTLKEDNLRLERDTAAAHVKSVLDATYDVNKKLERCKEIIAIYVNNEQELKSTNALLTDFIMIKEKEYQQLKQESLDKMKQLNNMFADIFGKNENEKRKFNGLLRKADLTLNVEKQAVLQKHEENETLAAMCDDIIQKISC